MGHRFQRRAAAHREGGPGRRWLRLGVAGALGAALWLIASGGLVSYATAKRGRSAPRAASALPRATSTSTPIYLDTSYSFAERAADLVSRMTLAEKVAQLRTDNAPAIPRLGVQQYTYWNEGQHGINALGADTNPGGVTGGVHATSFPTNFAASMSWDPSLLYSETTAISDEARGFLDKSLWNTGQNNLGPSSSDYGSLTFWAPTVNMDRDPRWGRTDEAFGEDPYLTSQMASSFIDGYQGESMSGVNQTPYLKVAATAKHYALNNVEQQRSAISSNVTDTDLHDYYTAQFKAATENAHVSGLMTSVNAIDGTPAMVDTYTDNQVAQRTYGFNGYSTTDCGLGVVYRNPPNGHDWAPPGWTTDSQDSTATWTNTSTAATVSGAAGAQAYALRAGTDLNCPGPQATLSNIEQAVNAGILSEGVIDSALERIFTMRMKTGEFDPPSQVPYTSITSSAIQSPAHQSLAQQVADNSLVLLKNDNVSGTSAPLLPADPAKLTNVVILGDLANKVVLGGYSGAPSLKVTAVQGITAAVQAANPNANVVFDAAGTSTTTTTPAVLSAQTQTDIQNADLVIVVAGTDAAVAGEGHDRSTLAMPGNYNSLIDQVAALGNPRTALVIQSDGPVQIAGEQGKVPAILFSGYNGESQGAALADVLFGKQNPSGHLDFTWYSDDSQLPAMSNYGLTPSATGGLGRTYMYFTGAPTYPFGYGLSYTRFRFSNLTLSATSRTANGSVDAHFTVTNTGTQAGAAVAQLFVATPFSVAGVQLPAKRLEGFQKTQVLAPGQSQSVTLTVSIPNLAFWNQQAANWVVYDGPYQFQLGSDSSSIAATQTVNVSGAITPHVKYVTVQPENLVYKPGDSLDLTGKNHWIADDTNPSLEQRNLAVTADHVVEAVNNDGSFVNLSTARVGYASSNSSVARVSSTGIMKAVAPGVATIRVTVNGVTGSAVIIVKQPLTVSAPQVVAPGSTFTATTTLANPGASRLNSVTLSLTAPAGWTVTATSPTSFATLSSGQTVHTTWQVSAPTTPGNYQLTAQATYQIGTNPGTATNTSDIEILSPSLSGAFDNPGISDDANTSAGNLDGGGLSYSAQALGAAGLTPGATVTAGNLSFTWPNAPSGTPDNVVAGGQTIALSGSGGTLGFLGTGDYGTASGSGTITYSDGTTQGFSISFADWYANNPTSGDDIVATMPYHNNSSGRVNHSVSVYYASVPLDPGKTVQDVTLPDVSSQAMSGQVAMHIFAISVTSAGGAYQNPVYTTAAMPDPFVLDNGGTQSDYWAFGTGDLFPVLHSTDLVHWSSRGTALTARPSWVVSTGDWNAWAPSVIKTSSSCPGSGSANCYIMYYTGLSAQSGLHCIGVATSQTPGGPYTDQGPLDVTSPSAGSMPLGCGDAAGVGNIDPSPFVDSSGQTYLYVRTDRSCTGGTCVQQRTVSVIPLTSDLLHASGARVALFSGDAGTWEAAGLSVPTVEGPFVELHNGTYYLFYSGGNFQGAYGMGYATASSPAGPFTKSSANPIFTQTSSVLGPGGGDQLVSGPHGGLWLLYAARSWSNSATRTLRLEQFSWHPGSPDTPAINGPTSSPQSTQP